jgi:hypothetical protein
LNEKNKGIFEEFEEFSYHNLCDNNNKIAFVGNKVQISLIQRPLYDISSYYHVK